MVNDDEVGGNVYYDGDTFTYVDANGETQIVNVKKLVQDNESQTVIITIDDQQYYISEAYLSENDGVVPTTVDPTAIPDGIYLIDVIGGVTNNFEEIYNNIVNEEITVNGDTYNSFEEYITHVTESTGGFTKIVYDQTTGDAIFQEWDEVTNTWVNVDNSKFETIVQANESQTVIITVDDQQYYVSEAYLAVNDGVVPTTVDPTAIPDGIYLIDVIGGVTNNFEEIYNNIVNEEITINDENYNSFEEYITYITESTGGFTKIVYDETTGDVIFQEWDEITNTWVNVDNSKFETIVQANESQTLLVQTTEEDLQYYVAEQYLQNNPSPNQTEIDGWDPTALPAGVYLIDVIGGVTNNFEEIYNNIVNKEITVNGDEYNSFEEYITHVTESTGGFTKIVYDQTTGDAIFQEWDEITNTWVNVDNSKFETIVQANESQTLLVQTTEEDLQYYVAEQYLQNNPSPNQTEIDGWDPTALPAGVYLIDVIGGVTNNFEEIYNNIVNEEITVKGDIYNSFEEYITHVTESTGGFTKIVYDQTTGDAIFQEWDEVTNTWVNVDNSKFETIVQDNESQTLLVQTTEEDLQYYVAEQYLQNNPSPNQTEIDGWDPTALPAGVYLIDVIGGVTNNFEEIYNNIVNEEITVNGDTYNSFEEYITHVTESTGGFTKIVYDQTTGDAIFQEWDEVTNT